MSRIVRAATLGAMLLVASAALVAQRNADQHLAVAELVAPKQPGYVVPRTPWGDPDLNGVWPDIDMVRVPVQRAPQYGTRLIMTPDEHAALVERFTRVSKDQIRYEATVDDPRTWAAQ